MGELADAKQGIVRLPLLPHRQPKPTSTRSNADIMARWAVPVAETVAQLDKHSRTSRVFSTETLVSARPSPISTIVVQQIRVPESEVQSYWARYDAGHIFDRAVAVRLASLPEQITSPTIHRVLRESERQSVQRALKDTSAKDVLLMIADTGWPDESTFKESRPDVEQDI